MAISQMRRQEVSREVGHSNYQEDTNQGGNSYSTISKLDSADHYMPERVEENFSPKFSTQMSIPSPIFFSFQGLHKTLLRISFYTVRKCNLHTGYQLADTHHSCNYYCLKSQ